jgi:hypothetical protein
MRGYVIKHRLQVCWLGLALLAGCHAFGPPDCPQLPDAPLPARQGCVCGRTAPGSRFAAGRQAPAAVLTGIIPVTAASACVPATSAGPTPPQEMPAVAPPLRVMADTTKSVCGLCGPVVPALCSRSQTCVSCTAYLPYLPGLCRPQSAAALSFSPVPEPGRLPDMEASGALASRHAGKTGAELPAPEDPVRRRSFVDITAAPCFEHAPDYAWVSGQVEYSRVRKEWRLRYASVDETDRFGGRVTLIENEHLGYLADGQYVRLQGHLVNPNDPPGSPAFYRIEGFRLIDKPNTAAAPTAAAAPMAN